MCEHPLPCVSMSAMITRFCLQSAEYSVLVLRTGTEAAGRILDLKLEYFVILTVTVRTNQNTASGHVTQ